MILTESQITTAVTEKLMAAAAKPPRPSGRSPFGASPECGEGAVTPPRQAMYDRLVALAWDALDKLDVADGIVDPYEDGTPFCADLCGDLRDFLTKVRRGDAGEAEAIVLYAPDEGEVLIVDGKVIDVSEGVSHAGYLDNTADFFDDLGRALGIHFTVRVVEVDPCAPRGRRPPGTVPWPANTGRGKRSWPPGFPKDPGENRTGNGKSRVTIGGTRR